MAMSSPSPALRLFNDNDGHRNSSFRPARNRKVFAWLTVGQSCHPPKNGNSECDPSIESMIYCLKCLLTVAP